MGDHSSGQWQGRARALGVVLAAGLLAASAGQAADVTWKPTEPVEFVVGIGAGGGTDVYARFIQKILQEQRLTPTPLNVVNRPGGGGVVGLNYLAQRPADGHTISIGNATLVTTYLVGRSPIGPADVTPIAMLVQEYVAFAVKADSPLKTGKDLLAKLKEDPASLSIAIGAAVGNQNHIAVALAARSAGVDARKLKTVIFKSGGETITSILGGHVDVGMTSSSGFVKYVQAGTLRLIAVAAPRRLEGELASVPTWKELGADSVAGNWYAAYGAKGMPAAPVRYWDSAFAAMAKTEEWRKYVQSQNLSAQFMGAEETTKFFRAEQDKLRSVLVELGLAK
jgi:putative tricarboxylic transport membrane protein